jgi:hypothetical protein
VRRLSILLDADGVICNFTAGALKIVEEITGRRYEETDVTEFDFAKSLGLSADETRDVMRAIGARRGFAASLAPYPDARQGIRRLRELGDVFCVTHPWDENPWWRQERASWLALHFGIDRVHHEEDKSAYEADVFVDDRSKHVRAWQAAWPDRAAVFWRTLHNTREPVPAGAWSIGSWDALYEVVFEAARGVAVAREEVSP